MSDKQRLDGDYRGPSKVVSVSLSDEEYALIALYAEQNEMTDEEALQKLLSDGLKNRLRRSSRGPARLFRMRGQ